MVPMLLITAVGILMRVSTLTSLSFWVDEWYTLSPLRLSSLASYLDYIGFATPENVPLYFVMEYGLGKIVGPDALLVLRLFSVFLGVACIPILYAMTRSLYGTLPAIIAATCLALSPFHIDIAQGIRPNILTDFLSMVSLCSFVGVIRKNNRTAWTINIAANGALVWTHVMGVLLIAAEGLFVLLYVRTRPKRALSWLVALMLLVFGAYLWGAPMRSTIQSTEDDFYMRLPSLSSLAVDLLADDAVMSNDPFSFQGETWPFLPEKVQRILIAAHGRMDWLMVFFFGTCLASLAWIAFAKMRASWTTRPTDPEFTRGVSSAFLVCAVTLPIVALIVLAFVYRPTILPRYTSYASFACYAAAGAAIAAISEKALRGIAISVLLALYVYQLSVALPASTHTNWLGAERIVKADLSPGDLILVKGTFLAWDVLRLNWKSADAPVVPAYTLEAISEKSARFLAAATASGTAHPKVWAIIEPFIYTLPPLSSFENSLTQAGLRFSRTDLKGMNGLYIYRIERDRTAASQRFPGRIAANVDYGAVLNDMGYARDDAVALDTLRQMIDTEFPRTRFYYTLLAMHCLNEGCLSMGEAAARHALSLDPNYAFAHLILAAILGEKGDAAGALSSYTQALEEDASGFLKLYKGLFDAWYQRRDPDLAREECRRLDEMGCYMPLAFRIKTGLIVYPMNLATCGAGMP